MAIRNKWLCEIICNFCRKMCSFILNVSIKNSTGKFSICNMGTFHNDRKTFEAQETFESNENTPKPLAFKLLFVWFIALRHRCLNCFQLWQWTSLQLQTLQLEKSSVVERCYLDKSVYGFHEAECIKWWYL